MIWLWLVIALCGAVIVYTTVTASLHDKKYQHRRAVRPMKRIIERKK